MNFWEKPLATLDRAEWEALCDGCGKCCLHKVEDEETGRIYATNVACRLLDRETAQCSNYRQRRAFVPDCLRLTYAKLYEIAWLPQTCAYRWRADGKPISLIPVDDLGNPDQASAQAVRDFLAQYVR